MSKRGTAFARTPRDERRSELGAPPGPRLARGRAAPGGACRNAGLLPERDLKLQLDFELRAGKTPAPRDGREVEMDSGRAREGVLGHVRAPTPHSTRGRPRAGPLLRVHDGPLRTCARRPRRRSRRAVSSRSGADRRPGRQLGPIEVASSRPRGSVARSAIAIGGRMARLIWLNVWLVRDTRNLE